VILIDALDELRYRPIGNTVLDWLNWCPELPSNVRILVTSRSDPDWLADPGGSGVFLLVGRPCRFSPCRPKADREEETAIEQKPRGFVFVFKYGAG
jgi:hypothetical protein